MFDGLGATSRFVAEIRNKYGQQIPAELRWAPFTGGGTLHLRVQFVFAGFTEYLAVFAAPTSASGRSGELFEIRFNAGRLES